MWKSTIGRTVIRSLSGNCGQVLFNGEDVYNLKGAKLKQFNREMQMIFQDPYASLNPRMTVVTSWLKD